MKEHFETPEELQFKAADYSPEQLGNLFLTQEDNKLPNNQIVLIGITESGFPTEANEIREELYQLYSSIKGDKLFDLGNFSLLALEEFSFNHLSNIIAELLERNCLPIVFGGSEKTMYALQGGYSLNKQYMNAGMIHSSFQFSELSDTRITDNSYLMRICNREHGYLFNFTQIGYQSYFVHPKAIQLLGQLHFESLRLGKVRDSIQQCEPYLRDLDLLGVSVKALKFSETGNSNSVSPNGLYAEELAQLMKYAGVSDKLTTVGFFDYKSEPNKMGAKTIAQSIWCFLDGYMQRKGEWPTQQNSQQFLRYTVQNQELAFDIVFVKSKMTDRWWIEMPKERAMLKQTFYIPCAYEDYQIAIDGDLPDRWINGFNKLG